MATFVKVLATQKVSDGRRGRPHTALQAQSRRSTYGMADATSPDYENE